MEPKTTWLHGDTAPVRNCAACGKQAGPSDKQCSGCGGWLTTSKPPVPSKEEIALANKLIGKKVGWASEASAWVGVASIFLFDFSIVPIAAIFLGIIGLARGETKKVSAIAGIALGIIFLIVRFYVGPVDWGF